MPKPNNKVRNLIIYKNIILLPILAVIPFFNSLIALFTIFLLAFKKLIYFSKISNKYLNIIIYKIEKLKK